MGKLPKHFLHSNDNCVQWCSVMILLFLSLTSIVIRKVDGFAINSTYLYELWRMHKKSLLFLYNCTTTSNTYTSIDCRFSAWSEISHTAFIVMDSWLQAVSAGQLWSAITGFVAVFVIYMYKVLMLFLSLLFYMLYRVLMTSCLGSNVNTCWLIQ